MEVEATVAHVVSSIGLGHESLEGGVDTNHNGVREQIDDHVSHSDAR